MAEDHNLDLFELFKSDLAHDDTQEHIRALKMLPTVAVNLDVERTRHELIPFLDQYVQTVCFRSEESLVIIAEQLGKFSPFIGGTEYAHLLFPMLEKLAATDDMYTRENAVASLQHLASLMNGLQLEEHFVKVIKTLTDTEWFTSKCSAGPLFAVTYAKLSDDGKLNLRNMFSTLLQDESPMVRRAAATSFSDFIRSAEMECVKNEFIPSFKDLAKDDQDSVRLLAVNVAIALASRLTTMEIEEHIMNTLQTLCVDTSWRVRYRFANEINDMQLAIGPMLTRKNLIDIYKSLVHDTEANIREISARNIVKFCEILQASYQESEPEEKDTLDPTIKNDILPLIKELDQDIVEDVQDGLYSVITSLSSLLGEVYTKSFLLPLITNSIENESNRVKESIITNLNNIISVIGIEELSKTVEKLMTDLLTNSNTLWRTRRNLIVTLSHIAKHSNKEYFDEHLNELYKSLLSDKTNGVRRVAPLVLPFFAKHFEMAWTKDKVVEIMLEFVPKKYYLSRLTCLFCIDELVSPTLDKKTSGGYLIKLKCMQDKNSSIVLNKIHRLITILSDNLRCEWVEIVLKYFEDENYFNDDIKAYAEEAMEALIKCTDQCIVRINKSEIQRPEEESYLEGLLFLTLVYFLDIIRDLAQDKVYNVRMRAARTLHNLVNLNEALRAELDEPWVSNVLDMISTDEKEKIGSEIQNNLFNAHNAYVEKKKEMKNDEIPTLATGNSDQVFRENEIDAVPAEKEETPKTETDISESSKNVPEDVSRSVKDPEKMSVDISGESEAAHHKDFDNIDCIDCSICSDNSDSRGRNPEETIFSMEI